MADIKELMIQALAAANSDTSDTEANQKSIHNAKVKILTILASTNKERIVGEIGTDVIANLMIEALFIFKAKEPTHTCGYLTSKVAPKLEAELAWILIQDSIPAGSIKHFNNFISFLNRSKADCLKMSATAKFNVIKMLDNMDASKLSSKNPLRKVIADKAWGKLGVKITKLVKKIRPLIYMAFKEFASNKDTDYILEEKGANRWYLTKVKNVYSVTANYMFKAPVGLMEVHNPSITFTESVHKSSVEVALQSGFTFDEDYNNAIEKVIESGNHVGYFDAENEEALKAKVQAVESDVKNGLKFWEEIGKGEVFFNYVVDFRGRISQLGGLSAVGHKVGKAMLRAGKARKMGEHGLKHLLISLGGAMGHDKLTFADREVWGTENRDKYTAIGELVVTNPVEAFEQLKALDADDIFAAAAASLELYKISQHVGEIEDYKSNLFCGLDATSSGLQIVSLLWGNEMLAENTNVAQFERTENKIYDVYKYLYEAMDKVAEDFNPVTESTPQGEELFEIWDALEPKIKRKIAKVLLMPRIYGSTFSTWSKNTMKVAKKKNIFNYIEDKKEREEMAFQFGVLIAKLFKATFDKESAFQAFRDFDNVVGQVATAFNTNTLDTTWIVHEPSVLDNQAIKSKYAALNSTRYYVYDKGQKVKVRAYNVSIFNRETKKTCKQIKVLNKAKAKNAISPNFIHSLDALLLHTVNYRMSTSMRLTHDCFACTPGEVERMIETINNSYVDLFGGENNIIKKLAADTKAITDIEIIIPDTLNTRGIDCASILKGAYKFS